MKVLLAGLFLVASVSGVQAATIQQFASGSAAPTTLGGYAMTAFDVTNSAPGVVGTTTTSIASPLGGTLDFVNSSSNPTNMTRALADSTTWWKNYGGVDYDIFTTNLHVITIVLPENTQAFYFNVGANLGTGSSNNAWLTAAETNGSGIQQDWFRVDQNKTPGFGIYADSHDCSSSIRSVTIDPLLWGFGNFSISQGSCTSVPESSSVYLLVFGLLGLLVTARRMI